MIEVAEEELHIDIKKSWGQTVRVFLLYNLSQSLNQFSHIDRYAGSLSVFPQIFRVEQVAVSDS